MEKFSDVRIKFDIPWEIFRGNFNAFSFRNNNKLDIF